MRPLEASILLVLLLALIDLVRRRPRTRWTLVLPGVAVLLVLADLVLVGGRWQMVPAWFVSGTVLLAAGWTLTHGAPGSMRSRRHWVGKAAGVLLGGMALAVTAAALALFPVFELPAPTGPHAIGTRYFHLTDSSRPDTYTSTPGDSRQISLQAWYPVDPPARGEPIPFMSGEATAIMAEHWSIRPAFLTSHYRRVRTHAHLGVEPSLEGAPHPVVLFSPSIFMTHNAALFEELASHGYVVLCVGHPYWNAFTFDADGEILPLDSDNDHFEEMWREERSSVVNETKEAMTVATSVDEKQRLHRRLNELMPTEVSDLLLWSEDLAFVLEELASGRQGLGLFEGRLDLERVGVMGFSKGGASTGQFCVADERCRAGVNLGGFMFGDAVESPLRKPFLFIDHVEPWCEDCLPIHEHLYQRAESSAYAVQVHGARHMNFTDWSLAGGFMKLIGVVGPIDGRRFVELENRYVLAFFDRHLKGEASPFLDGPPDDYPEVVFKARHPKAANLPGRADSPARHRPPVHSAGPAPW
jgi:predicted dienelactone hydrolase